MKVKFYTLGCKVNQYETEALKKELVSAGFQLTQDKADIYVINTCSVTARADSDSRKFLLKTRKLYPTAKIAVCGCWVNTNKEIIKKMGADFIIDQKNKQSLADILKGGNAKDKDIWALNVNECSNRRAFLKIQDGCNNFCSFCKVPFLRGTSRSRKREDIIAEAQRLSNKHKEIVLCGINLGLYGKDLEPQTGLAPLVNDILKINTLGRLRLSSLEPYSLNDEVAALFKDPKMCPHLHLPFQSGDDDVLKAMNKKETASMFRDAVAKLRAINPDIAIGCDIIVGLPGETGKNFENTLQFITEIKPMRMHIFTFSPREKTKLSAQKANNTVAKVRYAVIKKMAEKFSLEYKNKFIGKVLNVIPEEEKENVICGYSENYIKVKFRKNMDNAKSKGGKKILNQIVPVLIESVDIDGLSGVAP